VDAISILLSADSLAPDHLDIGSGLVVLGKPMRRTPRPPPPPLDRPTIEYAVAVLEERLRAVEAYGAGGCPTCHDAEMRGAIAKLRELVRNVPQGA
jgi:hypothetical protein